MKKKCLRCKKEFFGTTTWQKYCTASCRQEAINEARRQPVKETK